MESRLITKQTETSTTTYFTNNLGLSSENKGTTIKKNDNVTMVLQSSFAIKECIPVGCVPAAH